MRQIAQGFSFSSVNSEHVSWAIHVTRFRQPGTLRWGGTIAVYEPIRDDEEGFRLNLARKQAGPVGRVTLDVNGSGQLVQSRLHVQTETRISVLRTASQGRYVVVAGQMKTNSHPRERRRVSGLARGEMQPERLASRRCLGGSQIENRRQP